MSNNASHDRGRLHYLPASVHNYSFTCTYSVFCVLESCPWNASRLRRFFAFIHSRYVHYLTFHDFVFTILIFPLLPYYLTFLYLICFICIFTIFQKNKIEQKWNIERRAEECPTNNISDDSSDRDLRQPPRLIYSSGR